ncbi:plasminogen activator inhibitor 1 RNA-binding protein-like [Tripterygium wilfordii]|uniref:Plasminogen activator inhibitor 1 RNA-binding protein-like n=1 Tax=Tripterygium wilfordii TaxID=458696 RepID=A0A7J7DD33_TRIWF|nr:RGG repeats nuclear RNA binding protein A-like [Tripterygium wilfordii]KAF5744270.1 plasminogen activator inhibitor 1 RNA-binding protein-like [Tripterygium wilfordii]
MATMNPFDLLGDDAEDPSQLIAAQPQKVAAATKKELGQGKPAAAAAQQNKPAKLPSKPLPPAQAVRETRTEAVRGGGRGGGLGSGRGRSGGGLGYGRGRGGGGRGYDRDSVFNENSYNSGGPAGQGAPEDREAAKSSERRGYGGPRGPHRGGRFGNGEVGDEERTRRPFERHSGTGRGNGFKREGSGRGNWGTPTDELSQVTEEVANENEKSPGDVKPVGEEDMTDLNKETPANEPEEKEPEDKEMTLEEYEKVLEEKRKALQALKTKERRVDVKEFESMQQISNKKGNDDVFIKLGSEKDKRKEAEKDEKVKKSVSINEFLKPAEGERYHGQSGRGRGRGRGSRGFSARDGTSNVQAPAIEDPGQFPTLGGK